VAQAGVQTLFLEQYLDQPIERAISTALGRPIRLMTRSCATSRKLMFCH
jgi:hypothetical protein